MRKKVIELEAPGAKILRKAEGSAPNPVNSVKAPGASVELNFYKR